MHACMYMLIYFFLLYDLYQAAAAGDGDDDDM